MICSFDHFTLIVCDLQRTKDFYQNVLGLKLLDRPNFDFEGLWFAAGEIQIHMILENQLTGAAGIVHRKDARPSRHIHFAFRVDDFDSKVDLIRQMKVTILDGPKTRPDGARQLFIADPDNHVLELCQLN